MEREEIIEKKYNPEGGWSFHWLKPVTHFFNVYGLVTAEYPNSVQGLIALKPNYDDAFRCVDIDIIESSPHNKKMVHGVNNEKRKYVGIGRCLVAFACEYSINQGLEGINIKDI
ncbi:hypothetical protein [Lentibacillus sp. CBA3610]|uniref:hypothetical protein n=1 Tax=Lentibacillus sp. CBA3610 TaxID=2518176 RepID=UPI001595BFCC|nr:hypothetical protein [Lentibacillus sp. CBA3610]QKY68415.1 hypothetical protein Len3610_01160 [Lentibacillus sp. CBA3610]